MHHLLLVNHHAIGFLQNRLQRVIEVIEFFLALFTGDIKRDIIHRARAIERHQSDNVFEFIRFHFAQHVAHAGAFQLKHADRIAAAHQLIGRLIIERQTIDIDTDAGLRQQLDCFFQNGQGFQAEKVKLHQPRFFNPFHIELRHRHIRFRVAVKRHKLLQRPVTNHHTGGMG